MKTPELRSGSGSRLTTAVLPLAVLLLLAAVPFVASAYLQDLVVRILIFSIFALSLELLVGTTGLVSLGHAAFLGIGAYATVLGAPASDPGSFFGLLALAIVSAGLYAAVTGALSLRTKGVYFIMVTLAFAQMAYFIVHDTKAGGGSDGIYLNLKPVVGPAEAPWLDPGNRTTLFFVVLAAFGLVYALLALLLRSRFGHALGGIRLNEQRMRAAGFPTFFYKWAAFVIAGMLAAVAGFLIAVRDGLVNPEMLAWHESGAVLIMLILGGLGHLRGAVLGAVAFTLLKEAYQSQGIVGPLADHWQLTLGLTIIVLVAVMPKGLIGLPDLIRRRKPAAPATSAEADDD